MNNILNKWAEGLIKVGKGELQGKDFVESLYHEDALMKPTLALGETSFRKGHEDILSYFIKGKITTDGGFALRPWVKVEYSNYTSVEHGNVTVITVNPTFTDNAGESVTADFTMTIIDGKIALHHSSLHREG